jgi:CheY-like chemotaxis protein/anti-sigma regulatory factor (Ser/Thr protein kinase)
VPDARILVVDDDPDIHVLLATILRDAGYHIDSAFNGLEGLERLQAGLYNLVLTDVLMPGLDGLELLQRIQERCPSTPVVVMTASKTPDNLIRSIREMAFSYFSKPFSPSAVVEMVGRALQSPPEPDDIEVLSARPRWIALQLRCKLAVADRLLQFLHELPLELPAEEQDDIATAFRELLINGMEHGGRLDPQQKVEVAYIRLSQAILYYIRDPGIGFSFDNLAHAAVSGTAENPFGHVAVRLEAGMRPGGFGIFMTRRIADELVYNEKGNQVLLVKYLPAQTQP